jgi:hypothetical protein
MEVTMSHLSKLIHYGFTVDWKDQARYTFGYAMMAVFNLFRKVHTLASIFQNFNMKHNMIFNHSVINEVLNKSC